MCSILKAVILSGGYATRMWPLTKNKPKQLLLIAGKPLLDYVISILESLPNLNDIFISTNAKFENDFKTYANKVKSRKNISINSYLHMTVKENAGTGQDLPVKEN